MDLMGLSILLDTSHNSHRNRDNEKEENIFKTRTMNGVDHRDFISSISSSLAFSPLHPFAFFFSGQVSLEC